MFLDFLVAELALVPLAAEEAAAVPVVAPMPCPCDETSEKKVRRLKVWAKISGVYVVSM